MSDISLSSTAQAVINRDRRALARAITLVESTLPAHRAQASALISELVGQAGKALRIGLTGTPGVGKSTFIEAFGLMLTKAGRRVAVLAVDPSSTRSGGSILGDKTRMEQLARQPNAFIRPSPSQTALGGVARRTREAALLCEAAGYDIILIETVGVGQSETMVADMVDIFLLLLAPAGGDELQGVKRGIMEIADIILVNKADGDLKPAAMRTVADYSGALHLLRKRSQDPEGFPKASPVSAITGDGMEGAWQDILTLKNWRDAHGVTHSRRIAQAQAWFHHELELGLLAALDANLAATALRGRLEAQLARGTILPDAAADQVLALLLGKNRPNG